MHTHMTGGEETSSRLCVLMGNQISLATTLGGPQTVSMVTFHHHQEGDFVPCPTESKSLESTRASMSAWFGEDA